jgi:hypothetical protein
VDAVLEKLAEAALDDASGRRSRWLVGLDPMAVLEQVVRSLRAWRWGRWTAFSMKVVRGDPSMSQITGGNSNCSKVRNGVRVWMSCSIWSVRLWDEKRLAEARPPNTPASARKMRC